MRRLIMSFKDIMVFIDSGKSGMGRGRYAISLADHFGAHLTIMSFVPTAIVFAYGEPGVIAAMPASYFDDQKKQAAELLGDLAKEAGRQGVGVDTRLLDGIAGDLPHVLGEQARYADLMIVGQPREGALWSTRGEMISRLLMGSGRPILIVPYTGAVDMAEGAPKTIIAAWDGSAEATRAFHDALPLLKTAKKTILFVGEPVERTMIHGDEPGADIARHLLRHGVEVEVRQAHSQELDIGELILSRTASESADLIVMGGFHHSKMRELLIGGVTKTILEHMTVPVFMSH
jgi:nucleotide-binding universal stress UspA family protein